MDLDTAKGIEMQAAASKLLYLAARKYFWWKMRESGSREEMREARAYFDGATDAVVRMGLYSAEDCHWIFQAARQAAKEEMEELEDNDA